MVQSLRKEGATVDFTKIIPGNTEEGGQVISSETFLVEEIDLIIVHTVPEYFPFWLRYSRLHHPEARIWGYTTWETNKLPIHWTPLLNLMDGIFVPSHWNREVFIHSGVLKPVEVLPHVSQFMGQPPLSPTVPVRLIKDQFSAHFLFYSVGVWNERKAPWILVKSFMEEFSPEEPVALILKTGKTDWCRYQRRWKNFFRKSRGDSETAFAKLIEASPRSKILHITSPWTDNDMASLHSLANCFISTTRGEGWGMSSYEAAWFSNPVILTGFGGSNDYLPPQDAYLIDYQLAPVRSSPGQESYTSDQQWASPSKSHVRHLMREVFSHQSEAAARGARLGQYVAQNFDPSLIASKISVVFNYAHNS